MSDQGENEAKPDRSLEARENASDKPPLFHENSQNVSQADVQAFEQKRSSRWKGTFSGEEGEKLPAIKSGMTLDQANNASETINKPNRLTIDFGDGRVMNSDGAIISQGTGRNDLPIPSPTPFLPGTLDQAERDKLDKKFDGWVEGKVDWNTIRDEVSNNAKPIASGLAEMLANCRVLAIGEYHLQDNALRDAMPQVIETLKQKGATHLAVEMSPAAQPILDKIYENNGLITPKMQKELESIADLEAKPNFLAILKAATQSEPKLHLVAVDSKDSNKRTLQERNQHMATAIEKVLSDPNAKIVWIGGDDHIAKLPETTNLPNAAQQLRARKVSILTVNGCDIPHFNHTLTAATPDLTSPVVLQTKDLKHIPDLFIDLTATLHNGLKYNAHDAVVLFPHPVKQNKQSQ